MTERPAPNIGALLAGFMAQVPEAARPCFLAQLERRAAERYRYWAEQLPEQAAGLRACAAREEEIAGRAEGVLELEEGVREKLDGPLQRARTAYFEVFEGMPLVEQLRVQAGAERLGAGAWRGFAAAAKDTHVREELEHCAHLEEVSADFLDGIVSR